MYWSGTARPALRSSLTLLDCAIWPRWCLVLADEQAPDGSHVHLDPGTEPLATTSMPLLISREGRLAV